MARCFYINSLNLVTYFALFSDSCSFVFSELVYSSQLHELLTYEPTHKYLCPVREPASKPRVFARCVSFYRVVTNKCHEFCYWILDIMREIMQITCFSFNFRVKFYIHIAGRIFAFSIHFSISANFTSLPPLSPIGYSFAVKSVIQNAKAGLRHVLAAQPPDATSILDSGLYYV